MDYYADSSFLVSCYIVDANTAQAKAWLTRTGARITLTGLHALEVGNAFRLGVFRGLFSPADAAAAWANVECDLRAGRLTKRPVNWPLAFRVGARLSKAYSTTTGTRSLDVLHVAIAKTLRANELVSFDLRQRALASAIGFAVTP